MGGSPGGNSEGKTSRNCYKRLVTDAGKVLAISSIEKSIFANQGIATSISSMSFKKIRFSRKHDRSFQFNFVAEFMSH
jgi:hypothetical protein